MADSSRTVLVLGQDAGLWARLQTDLPRSLVIVRSGRPGRLDSILTDIHPWPWVVTGEGPAFPGPVGVLTARLPIPVFWWSAACRGLPAHAQAFGDWRPMIQAIRQALSPSLPGARFLPVRGLSVGNGGCVQSPELEGLVAAYPRALPIEPGRLRRVNAQLERHGLGWRAERVGRTAAHLVV